jgi:hypothetical protein
MFGPLRHHQPANILVAVLYWTLIAAVALVALFALFTVAERFLPGGGQF